jgi:Flp pilus assembly protein TadD
MLTDRNDLPLSTASEAARDAYVAGMDIKLSMYPNAIAEFDRAIEADPGFALAHVARAHTLLERGDAAAARRSMASATALAGGLPPREASHIAYFEHLVAGDSEAALTALPVHLDAWPRDTMVLGTAAFTNGLIGSSGRAGQKQTLLSLLDRLAPHFGADDWWFTAHHGMAMSENGAHAAARPKIERSLAQNPANPWAAHATAHLAYEEGAPATARAFLRSWLATYPRDAPLFSHITWHLALAELEAGDMATAYDLFHQSVIPAVHSGPPRGQLNDGVSFLWRSELAGHPRNAEGWQAMADLVRTWFPRAGSAFSDMHVAVVHAVAGDDAALAASLGQIRDLLTGGRYPSGPFVPTVTRGFAAFARGDFPAAIAGLEPAADALERIGGSHAQLDLVRFTLLKAYLAADRAGDAAQLAGTRRPKGTAIPVAGLPAAA